MGRDRDSDDIDEDFFKYVYVILAVVGGFLLLVGICICCKLRRRSTKGTIVYGGGRAPGQQGITTTQSVYHQYGRGDPQVHGTPVINAHSPPNAIGFPNPYYGNYSPQTGMQPSPYPTRNEFPQIPQQSQSQPVTAPYFTNEACNAPPSYEEIHTEVFQKQPPYNPNYTNNSNKY